jgi:hypothetical protein
MLPDGWRRASRLAVGLGLLIVAGSPCCGAEDGRREEILGCWTQESPYPRNEIPPDEQEWGRRTWCFNARGQLTTYNFACTRDKFCDGWDGGWRYRWRKGELQLLDWDYDEKGVGTRAWRSCLVLFTVHDKMKLVACYFSSDEWVRDKEMTRAFRQTR